MNNKVENLKEKLLNYGVDKGHYTIPEYNWCMDGNDIKKYRKSKENADYSDIMLNFMGGFS